MSTPLVGFLLRAGRFGWTLYALGLLSYGLLIVAFYPSLRDSPQLQEAMQSYPPELLAIFGIADSLEISSLPGFLAGEYFAFMWVVFLGAFAIASGSASVAGEVESGTIALLLATPMPRRRLLGSKIAAFALQLVGLVAATVLGLWLAGVLFGVAIGPSLLLPIGVLGFAFFLAIGGYATLLSAMASDRGRAGMLAVGLTVVFYLLQVLASLSREATWLRNLTIFSLYDPKTAMATGAVPWGQVLPLLAIAVATFAAAVGVFDRRDCAVG